MCSDVAIRVEGLSKRYRVPHRARQSSRLRAHLAEFLPFLGGDSEDTAFWALKDVSFEVKRGEVLGILGRNGSGKSTLLKILSRVTFPTRGRAELHGRVGSLLEVGTGFHPDLSGRENVFMSGALLGVSQREIRARFDEIVDFSGIEEFIDMPVKRYSSGMYVRLAYAVASLLDSDILILDEVLAVGDQAFKEKSRQNIERVTRSGRTVLFVSHSVHSLREICDHGIWLVNGQVHQRGTIRDVTSAYMRELHHISPDDGLTEARPPRVDLTEASGWDGQRETPIIEWVETSSGRAGPSRSIDTGDTLTVRIGYRLPSPLGRLYFTVFFIDEYGDRACVLYSLHDPETPTLPETGVVECVADDIRLIEGEYSIMLDCGVIEDRQLRYLDCIPDATRIRVTLGDYLGGQQLQHSQGTLAQRSRWRVAAD